MSCLTKYFSYRKAKYDFILFGFFITLLLPDTALSYIGPGAGFAVMGSFLVMFAAMFSALLAIFTWPIRYIIRAFRRRNAFSRSRIKKFVILGLDGLDPSLADKFMRKGKLPNLAKLRDQGCFKSLATTTPSISPVAWSSFQTCSNPGKHNIFDFLTRNRHTYHPMLSSVDIKGPQRKINIGKYQFPLGKTSIRLFRKSKSFWNILGENGIFSNIIRVPITFPPEKFFGVQLSAMCVPDLRGTQGMFSYYTTQEPGDGGHTGGDCYHVKRENNIVNAELTGPINPFRRDGSLLKCPFMITVIDDESADIRIGGEVYRLRREVYSEWIKVEFRAAPGIKVHGICMFLLLGTEPVFKLYVTPINIDPEKPVMPISHPAVYSKYFSKLFGPYATLGLAEDSWALNEKILSDDGFLRQCIKMDDEREKMFFDSLDKVKQGLCVCVFDGTDRIQHSFWRYIDEQHPAHQGHAPEDMQRRNAVEEVYRRMDDVVGKAVEKCCGRDIVFMVISDHGFTSFRYGVDLNRWLEERGYLKLKGSPEDNNYLSAIDWSETRAYAVGLAGIFLNIKGREAQGIVNPGNEADLLREEIAEQLSGLADHDRNEIAVRQVYNTRKFYRGPYTEEAPDLIIGYNRGYRASWETAIGKVTDRIFHDNIKAWSGDHCVDPSLVPGVLFCNRPVNTDRPRLIDIGPTVLDMFGINIPRHFDGIPLNIGEAPKEG